VREVGCCPTKHLEKTSELLEALVDQISVTGDKRFPSYGSSWKAEENKILMGRRALDLGP
jgi:hypothetical protein